MDFDKLRKELNLEFKSPGLVQILANDKHVILDGVSTGSMRLNEALSGSPFVGFVWGRIIEAFGEMMCVDADTFVQYYVVNKHGRIQNAKGGTIQRLYERFHGIHRKGAGFYQRHVTQNSKFYVNSMTDNNRLIRNAIADVVYTGRKECFRVRTLSGNEIICTSNHRFFNGLDYVALDNLTVGSTVYIHNHTFFRKTKKCNPYLDVCVKYHPSDRKKLVTANDKQGNKVYAYLRYRVKKSHLVFEAVKNNLTYTEYISILNSDNKLYIDSLWIVPRDKCIHHIDGDTRNDAFDNLELLSDSEHRKYHADKFRRGDPRIVMVEDVIESIVFVGYRETYDIKCFVPYNNYIANGFVVHNSGKTTLALHALAEAQKLNVPTAFIDAEHALDPTYARKIGVDFDKLLFIQPDSGEIALRMVESMIMKGVKFIVVDSVASLVPQAEIDGEIGDAHIGLQARLMSQALRKLVPICKKHDAIILFINQTRTQIGIVFGNPLTTPGGKALKFYSSYRLECRSPRGGAKKKKTLAGVGAIAEEVETSIDMNIKVVKNKLYPPFKKATVTIDYGLGFDKLKDIVGLLVYMGAFQKVKSGKNKDKEMLRFPKLGKMYTSTGLLKALRMAEPDADIRTEIIDIVKGLEAKVC